MVLTGLTKVDETGEENNQRREPAIVLLLDHMFFFPLKFRWGTFIPRIHEYVFVKFYPHWEKWNSLYFFLYFCIFHFLFGSGVKVHKLKDNLSQETKWNKYFTHTHKIINTKDQNYLIHCQFSLMYFFINI